jgi:hypothetical protein
MQLRKAPRSHGAGDQNAQRFVKTLQLDARNIARSVGRSTLMKRPPSR